MPVITPDVDEQLAELKQQWSKLKAATGVVSGQAFAALTAGVRGFDMNEALAKGWATDGRELLTTLLTICENTDASWDTIRYWIDEELT